MMRELLSLLALLNVAAAVPGEVAFATSTVLYREDAGTVNATLILYGPLANESTITFAIVERSPAVRAGEDYSPALFEDLVVPATDSNVTEFSLTLTIIDDDILEPFEVFEITATVVGNENQTATLSVILQDFGDSIAIDFEEAGEQIVALETASNLKACLKIVNGSTEGDVAITVITVADNSASSVTDFVPMSDVLVFSENVTRACAYIPIFNDTIVEREESFVICVSSIAGIELLRANISGIIEDANGAMVRFYNSVLGKPSSTFSVEEKNDNSALEICLQLLLPGPEPTERVVQVFLTTPESYSDDAESGMEFKSVGNIVPVTDRELSFAEGSTNGTIICTEIEIIGDLVSEPTSFFIAVIRLANDADTVVETDVARVILSDNDAQCPGLMDPSNGRVILVSTSVGSEAEYVCSAGYTLSGGDAVRVCEESGVWSGSPPTCTLIECTVLPAPVQGAVETTAGGGGRLVVGSQARYSCQSGFQLVGDSVRTCQNTGNWTGTNPTCVESLVPPATMNLGDGGSGVDTTLAITISSSVGGFLVFLAVAALLACLIRRRYKYSQKYYCSRVDIRVKKKETYTMSSSYANNSKRNAIPMRGVGIAEESDRSSNSDGVSSSYSSSEPDQEQSDGMVIENSFTNAANSPHHQHSSSEVQVHVEHVLTTLTPPKDGGNANDGILIKNTHIAATPEPEESVEELEDVAPPTTDAAIAATTATSNATDPATTSHEPVITVEAHEATGSSFTSDEATPLQTPEDQNEISKTDLTDSNSAQTDSFISDPIDLTVVSVSGGDKPSTVMDEYQDDSDSICLHTSTDLNSNLNNNILTKVSVLIENPNTGTTEVNTYAMESSGDDMSLGEAATTEDGDTKQHSTAATVSGMKEATAVNVKDATDSSKKAPKDTAGSRTSIKRDRKVFFV